DYETQNSYSILVRTTDSGGLSFDQQFTIGVSNVNEAPVATNGSLTTDEDTAASGMLSASDVDSPSLTYSLLDTSSAHGLVSITNPSTGAYSYVPAANFNGSASFTFKANDGSLDSSVATVSITVNPVNDAPVTANSSITTNEDTPTSGSLSASD